jgi:hypothetical protein
MVFLRNALLKQGEAQVDPIGMLPKTLSSGSIGNLRVTLSSAK